MPLGVTPITYSKGGLGVLSRVDGVACRLKKNRVSEWDCGFVEGRWLLLVYVGVWAGVRLIDEIINKFERCSV